MGIRRLWNTQKYSFYNKSKAQTWLENHSKKIM